MIALGRLPGLAHKGALMKLFKGLRSSAGAARALVYTLEAERWLGSRKAAT